MPILIGFKREVNTYELSRKACDYVVDYSNSMGFTSYDWYGLDTTESNILTAAEGDGASRSISFYVGHGNVDLNGYYIHADDGTRVYDYKIYNETSNEESEFAFLWSCHQGEKISGMPRAWHHTTDLSTDGYHSPDGGGLAFLGFKNHAPYLMRRIEGVDNAGDEFVRTAYYYLWYYEEFYGSAIVNGALNDASQHN